MRINTIRSTAEMNALAEEWNQLVKISSNDVPFLRHEYLSTWWQTLGGGEWDRGELYVVTIRQESGELVGIAPLFLSQNRSAEPALLLLGSIEISDYLDVIVRPTQQDIFLDLLCEHLDSSQAPAWQVLDWYNLLDSSKTLSALKAAAEKRGWSYVQEPLQHCPYIPLPGDWEVYLSGIDKKQRHEIRRKIRRLESHFEPTRWYIVEDEANLDEAIDAFLSLMAQDPAKKRFLSDKMHLQMHASAQAGFRAGWLQLSFLEIGGVKAAGYLNFDYNNHVWVYNSGLNFEYWELSPGWVLLGYLLRWAIENQRSAFDFMRGDEDYKYRFGAVDRRVMRAVVRR